VGDVACLPSRFKSLTGHSRVLKKEKRRFSETCCVGGENVRNMKR
jgi:hypothetical protein